MTTESDAYRAASVLIKRYGDEAPMIAARRAAALLERGDLDGHAVWKLIIRAIEEITRSERRADEQMN